MDSEKHHLHSDSRGGSGRIGSNRLDARAADLRVFHDADAE